MASKPDSSIVDVLDRVIGLPTSGDVSQTEEGPAFVPSEQWSGSKAGYVFRAGSQGTGYYVDRLDTVDDREAKRAKTDVGFKETTNHRSVRFDSTRDTTLAIPPRSSRLPQLSGEELLAQAEEMASQNNPSQKLFDPSSARAIQSAAASLEKTNAKNQLLRAQYENDPEKFMMNELQLNDEIVTFKDAAVDVTCYERIVEFGVVRSFISLLSHDNSDVAMSVVSVLVELLDPMLLREDRDEDLQSSGKSGDSLKHRAYNIGLLANAFIDGGGLDSITSNLGRFDESVEEDAKGVEDILTLVESLLDLDRAGVLRSSRLDEGLESHDDSDVHISVVASICKTTLVSWLFNRIEQTNDNDDAVASAPLSASLLRLHSSEVLSTILQHEAYFNDPKSNRLACLPAYFSVFTDGGENPPAKMINEQEKKQVDPNTDSNVDGMEILLFSIAPYRKADPEVEVDCEFLENVFDALAASLLKAENVVDFIEKEGIELMLRCIREKVHSGGRALKVLNFALSGSSQSSSDNVHSQNNNNFSDIYKKACEVFVRAGGLKVLFPLYMARRSAMPCPSKCSEGGSELAKKAAISGDSDKSTDGALSKRAKRAAHARKRWFTEIEENVIHVTYGLTCHIDKNSKYDSHARLMVKFVEDDCEKCDRTIELCLKYDEKSRISEYQYFRSDEAEVVEQMGFDVDDAALGVKLRGGGDLFHRLCAILSFACVGSTRCHGFVRNQLRLRNSSIGLIREGLTEFASILVAGSRRKQLEHYLSNI